MKILLLILPENARKRITIRGESGTIYNYAEDNADFAEDSEDLDIYSHCIEQLNY
jgi:hypothetical protein